MPYWLNWLITEVTETLGLPALVALFIVMPVIVYTAVKGALLSPVAPAFLRFAKGPATIVKRYTDALNAFVDRLRPFFYDGDGPSQRLKSPITIYSTFLAIALGYTVTIFFLGWSLTGDANIGSVRLIKPDYHIVARSGIAIGWLLLGALVVYSVRSWPAGQEQLAESARKAGVPLSLSFILSLGAASLVFLSQYVSRLPDGSGLPPRTFGLSEPVILYVQIGLAILAFIATYRSDRYFSGFAYVASACFGLALGVPILIGIPFGVAVATYYVGQTPILASTALVPAAMLAFGFFVSPAFQLSEYGALALAAIACFPIALTMYKMNPGHSSRPTRLVYALATFLPVWIPVSFSANQITHPVAFAVVVFWFLIPLLNAVWDSLSWWATWALLDSLRDSLERLLRPLPPSFIALRRIWQVAKGVSLFAIHIVLNFLVSTALFFAMFFMVILGLRLIGKITPDSFTNYFVDVPALLSQIKEDPFGGNGFWLVMLVFITLFPALFHLLAVVFGVVAVALAPRAVQDAIEVVASSKNPLGEIADPRKVFLPAVNRIARYFAAGGVLIEITGIALLIIYKRWLDGYEFGDLLFAIGGFALSVCNSLGL